MSKKSERQFRKECRQACKGLEDEQPKPIAPYIGGLVGGFITILIGTSLLPKLGTINNDKDSNTKIQETPQATIPP